MSRFALPLILLAGLSLTACSESSEPTAGAVPASAAAPPMEPLPPLRTGALEPEVLPEVQAQILAQHREQGFRYLALRLPDSADAGWGRSWTLDDPDPRSMVLPAPESTLDHASVLVRVPDTTTAALRGDRWQRNWSRAQTAYRREPWTVPADAAAAKSDATLPARWRAALADHLSRNPAAAHPWNAFAAARLQALDPSISRTDERRQPRSELSQLMQTTSGMLSIQEALQHDRGLRLADAAGKRDIALAELALPALAAHPFEAMQAQLPHPHAGHAEPMAAAAPADFWYLRFDDIRVFLRLLDAADAWLTPVVQILDAQPSDHQLAQRYQAQLGLDRSGLAKVLGHAVVGSIALVGSDPYLREGSDVSILFKVKQQALFDQELDSHLAHHRTRVSGIESRSLDYQGVSIQIHADPTGNVRQHRAQVEDLVIVSNSARALERILDTLAGRHPSLADEADFRYMLARDPGQHAGLAFLSDRFIAAVISPAQKVQAARRQQAAAELMTPGYAALLYGWLHGVPPADLDTLLASKLLDRSELKHADGSPITYTPGQPARSAYGTVAALTPLLELAPVTHVSSAERDAYGAFVNTYQTYWRQFIDPVATRFDLVESRGSTRVVVDVRILPLISGTDYSQLARTVGEARVGVTAESDGLQMVWGVGADASLRHDLDSLLRSGTGQRDVGLGWLGDWVMLGVDDRAALLELWSYLDQSVQLPTPRGTGRAEFEDVELWQRIGRLPVYAAAEVRNPVMLVATLTAVRTMLGQVAPGMIDWREAGQHRDLPIVRIGVARSAPLLPNPELADRIGLHYVQTGSAIVFALDRGTLERRIDRMLDGTLPKAQPAPTLQGAHAPQFVFDARSSAGRPLSTALLWLLQGQAYEAQAGARHAATLLLRGAPALVHDRAGFADLAAATLGYLPVNAQGVADFTWDTTGAGDALTGSMLVPRYPALPIAQAPVTHLLQQLQGLRGEVSFDREPEVAGPQARSLHTRLELQLAPL